MKTIIADEYKELSQEIAAIPSGNYQVEKTFCNKRNVVEQAWIGRKRVVIKKFKRPTIANCFVYTFLRKTKPRRAFEHAQRLLAAGIETARPVAYIEERRNGIFHTGYFVSEFLPYPALPETFSSLDEEGRERLLNDFVSFTLDLHNKRILPLDYNASNILVNKRADGYSFALVDINRMRFGKQPTLKQTTKSFVQLCRDYTQLSKVLPLYVERRGEDIDKSMFYVLVNRIQMKRKKQAKDKLKLGVKSLNGRLTELITRLQRTNHFTTNGDSKS